MSARDDILKALDKDIRESILAEQDRYAPLLALFAAWKEEVDRHVEEVETRVVGRLAQELFPKGDWRFPAQTLIVPQSMTRRDYDEPVEFTDRAEKPKPWTQCGPGWTLPTRMTSWSVEQHGWDTRALVCTIEMDDPKPDARMLTPPLPPADPFGQRQLAFVGAPERIVAELAAANWALQYPSQPGGAEQPFRPITVTRYQGYLDFERGIGAARIKQRQLELWLPPFYPYARKFLQFSLPGPVDALPAQSWGWLGTAKTIRMAALIPEKTADYLMAHSRDELIVLNAIPVVQMRTRSESILENPDPVGASYRIPFMGISGCFAATVRQSRLDADGAQSVFHPSRLLPSSESRARAGVDGVDVECDQTAARAGSDCKVRVHHDSFGEIGEAPRELFRPGGLRYSVPYPALGGMDSAIGDYDSSGARRSWFHAALRAPQLTEGDLRDILELLPDCKRYLDSGHIDFKLDIDPEPWTARTEWDSYLYPTLVSAPANDARRSGDWKPLEERASYLTGSEKRTIVPRMRIIFYDRRRSLPEFLMDDLMRWLASVISMRFMIGWYRVVAEMSASS